MTSRSVFWATLGQLAQELDKEGDTDRRRAENIAPVLERYSEGERAICLDDLQFVAAALPAILTHCISRDGESTRDSENTTHPTISPRSQVANVVDHYYSLDSFPNDSKQMRTREQPAMFSSSDPPFNLVQLTKHQTGGA